MFPETLLVELFDAVEAAFPLQSHARFLIHIAELKKTANFDVNVTRPPVGKGESCWDRRAASDQVGRKGRLETSDKQAKIDIETSKEFVPINHLQYRWGALPCIQGLKYGSASYVPLSMVSEVHQGALHYADSSRGCQAQNARHAPSMLRYMTPTTHQCHFAINRVPVSSAHLGFTDGY